MGRDGRKMLAAAYCESLEPGARLEFHVGRWQATEVVCKGE